MKSIKLTIANNIKKIRTTKGISQKELADSLSKKQGKTIYPAAISHWEKGDYSPDVDTLFDICEILEVLPSELFGEKEKPAKAGFEEFQKGLKECGISDEDILVNKELFINIATSIIKNLKK